MKPIPSAALAFGSTVALPLLTPARAADFSPGPDEGQLPHAMHSAMKVHPSITVGVKDADIVGDDNRALQAAVDYIGKLGGGTVEIGPGDYLMRDSLHLRSYVTVRGTPGKTILRKAKGSVSPLAIDGDYGEETDHRRESGRPQGRLRRHDSR